MSMKHSKQQAKLKPSILSPINSTSISKPGKATLGSSSTLMRQSRSSPMISRPTSPNIDRRTTAILNSVNENPFITEFAFSEAKCVFPLKMLFEDYLCTSPKKVINLAGWYLSDAAFAAIADKCQNAKKINIEYCLFDPASLEALKGFRRLTTFSMQGTCAITVDIVKIFASWPMLMELNISECRVNVEVFRAISQLLKKLRHLNVSKCPGLNDFCLQEVAGCILRFRNLRSMDFSYCADFTDEGMLVVLNACPNVLTHISFSGCKCVTSLSIAGLRKRMSVLESLTVSHMQLTQSAFEWIAEGCRMLRVLDCTRCLEMDDVALPIIGARCPFLEELILVKCIKISDLGFTGFCNAFEGTTLRKLNLSECIECTDPSIVALSRIAGSIEVLRMNGLSQVTCRALDVLWKAATSLQHFEIACELKVTSTHRRTLMPHMNDAVLRDNHYSKLTHICLSGACLLTDIGACAIVRKCPDLLHIDVSYANGVSDVFVLEVARSAHKLKALIMSGCVKVTDVGIEALASGVCSKKILKLQVDGCTKVTDRGVLAIAYNMRQLQSLGLRSCDYISEHSLMELAAETYRLRSLDISCLDLVGMKAISFIARKHRYMTSLHCQSCNLTTIEFNQKMKNVLPLVMPVPRSCYMQPRSRVVREYNTFVLQVRQHRYHIKTIQKLFLGKQFSIFLKFAAETKRMSAMRIQRTWRGKRVLRLFHAMKAALVAEFIAAKNLQKQMRRMVAVRHARLKARYLRWHMNARTTLQRTFRGYRVRKRVNWMFKRLWSYYRKIGFLAHKLRVISDARKLHRTIVKTQSVLRMYLCWLRYQRTLTGFATLQYMVRDWLFRKWVSKTHMVGMLDVVEERVGAASRIQRNWKAFRFNKMVLPFTTYCSVEWNRMALEDDWFATCIQRRYRGWKCRWILNLPQLRYDSAAIIQAMVRGKMQRWRYPRFRKWLKGVLRKWRRVLNAIPTLEKGKYCKRIQRQFRRFSFMSKRHDAAASIQARYRIYFAHCIWAQVVLDKRINAAHVMTRCIRIVSCRKKRLVMHHRQHMAAWKIQYKTRNIQTQEARKRIKYATAIRDRKKLQAEKAELATKRRMKAVNKIIARWKNKMARRIQRVFGVYIKEKRKREEVRQNRKLLRQEVREELTELKQQRRAAAGGFDPAVLLGRAAATVGKFITGKMEIVSQKDRIRCLNSVLKFQTMSIEQEGLMDIKMTQGEMESQAFTKEQVLLRNEGSPYFERVERDLSGNMGLMFYLWFKRGSGMACICEIEVAMKPLGQSNVAMNARVKKMHHQCVQIAWHPNIHVEVRGNCTIKAGKGGFAIRDVAVSYSAEEDEELVAKGYQLAKDLRQFGLTSSLYYFARKPIDDDNVYELKTLDMFEWMDKRLYKCVQTYNFVAKDIFDLRWAYEEILPPDGKMSNQAELDVMFRVFELEQTQITKWMVETVKLQNPKRITFAEFVQLISSFVILSNRDLVRFIFGCFDVDGRCMVKKEKFNELITIFLEGSGRTNTLYLAQYEDFMDKRLKGVLFTSFEQFVYHNPVLLWGAQKIQRNFRQFTLGEEYWFKKIEQFRLVRKELGVKQQ